MAADEKRLYKQTTELKDIKERLRAGRLTAPDLKQLENIVLAVETASAALRAAVVE